MPVRASIDPLEWENRFFAVNSAIVRFDEHAPRLTPEALAGWSRVQAKIAASDTVRLDALQRLGFQLVEGEQMPAQTSPWKRILRRCASRRRRHLP